MGWEKLKIALEATMEANAGQEPEVFVGKEFFVDDCNEYCCQQTAWMCACMYESYPVNFLNNEIM